MSLLTTLLEVKARSTIRHDSKLYVPNCIIIETTLLESRVSEMSVITIGVVRSFFVGCVSCPDLGSILWQQVPLQIFFHRVSSLSNSSAALLVTINLISGGNLLGTLMLT